MQIANYVNEKGLYIEASLLSSIAFHINADCCGSAKCYKNRLYLFFFDTAFNIVFFINEVIFVFKVVL